MVASPLYKQHYDLQTGECLEDDSVTLKVWPVRVEQGDILLGLIILAVIITLL